MEGTGASRPAADPTRNGSQACKDRPPWPRKVPAAASPPGGPGQVLSPRKIRASGGCRPIPAPAILLRLRRRDLHQAGRAALLGRSRKAEQVIRVHDPIAAGRRAALRAVAVQGLVVALLAAAFLARSAQEA